MLISASGQLPADAGLEALPGGGDNREAPEVAVVMEGALCDGQHDSSSPHPTYLIERRKLAAVHRIDTQAS